MIAHKSEDRISLSKVMEILEDPDVISEFQQKTTKSVSEESRLAEIRGKTISISTLLQQKKKTG
jgi:hypothetical protein